MYFEYAAPVLSLEQWCLRDIVLRLPTSILLQILFSELCILAVKLSSQLKHATLDLSQSKFFHVIFLFAPSLFPLKTSFGSDATQRMRSKLRVALEFSHVRSAFALVLQRVRRQVLITPRWCLNWLSYGYREICYSANIRVLIWAALPLSRNPCSELGWSKIACSLGVSLR